MSRILFMCLDAAFASIALLPLYLILNRQYLHSRRKTLYYFLFSLYLCAVYSVVGLPNITYIRLDFHFNFTPFAYMFSDYVNSLLNVALFIPLGIFLSVFWNAFRPLLRTTLFGFCTSLLIELLQIFTFRATDVNDLMTNTLGTIVGWCIGQILLKLLPRIKPSWKTTEVYLVCSVSFCVMFFIQPFLSNLFYFIV